MIILLFKLDLLVFLFGFYIERKFGSREDSFIGFIVYLILNVVIWIVFLYSVDLNFVLFKCLYVWVNIWRKKLCVREICCNIYLYEVDGFINIFLKDYLYIKWNFNIIDKIDFLLLGLKIWFL